MNTYADPWVFEGLFGSDSLGWVDGQHLVNQVLCLGSHRVPLWGGELRKGNKRDCWKESKESTETIHVHWMSGGTYSHRLVNVSKGGAEVTAELIDFNLTDVYASGL